MGVNKAILLGNAGCDPVIRYVQGRPSAEFSLATDEKPYVNPQGVHVPARTEWHNIVMWDDNALTAEKYIRKGTRLYIEGRLRTRVLEERSSFKRTRTYIVAETFDILGRSTAPDAPRPE